MILQKSHELPKWMLSYSYEVNDYEYLLPSFYSDEEYKNHFLKARKDGRFIIMDNGLFEGDIFTLDELLNIIWDVEPDIFIVPDTWNDAETTYKIAKYWVQNVALPERTKLMVVMQGEFYADIANLYLECKAIGYDHFAFNHSSKQYQNIMAHPNPLVNQMMGRIWLVSQLKKKGIIKDGDYIHLLGCSLPQEFAYYEEITINSIDTANPVILGCLETTYPYNGLFSKPTEKLKEFFELKDKSKFEVIKDFIIFNIRKFAKFIQ